MYLKSIDLQGFKSFTDKTQVKLDGGISCIVGPNGSGKSNIADAVRWVLGEQSARVLRGQKMEDVIFSGSTNRKPVGMAEVVLNIDNSDGQLPVEFAEVSVCRRTYRSGDSEYLLNGKQCRLKDIQELFMDSGISNNSLAMVGQGRVQQIVEMRPEERRSLIEEAAGVIKYRNRKKTAVRKLNDTEKNLDRIWDIISELADRLEPLAEQKTKAEKYLELKKEADSREINLLLQILSENKEKLEQIRGELTERREQLESSTLEQSEVSTRLEALKGELAIAEAELNETRQALFNLKTEKEREEARAGLLDEKQKGAAANISRIEGEIELLLNRDDGFMLQVEKLTADRNAKGEVKAELAASIAEAEQEFARQKDLLDDLNGSLELARDELFDLAGQLTNCKNELTYQGQNIEENVRKIADLQAAKQALSTEKADLENQLLELQSLVATAKNDIEIKKQAVQAGDARLHELTAELQKAAEAEVAGRMQLNSEQSRLKVLRELAESLDGFHPGVRALLKCKQQGKPVADPIYGVVVDLIEADKEHAVALEAALAGALQYLVVKDDVAAKKAIAYLKAEQMGRATFLPVDNLILKPKRELDRALNIPGVIGRASDVVSCEERVRPAVEFLLNNILFVEDLDVATRVAREHKQSFKIITLAGDVISTGGVITGGSKQKNTGDLLKKKAELKELEKSVAALTAKGAEQQAAIQKLRTAEAELVREREELMAGVRATEIDLIKLTKDLDHLALTSGDKDKQAHLYELDIKETELDQARLIERRAELESEIANWQQVNEDANRRLAEIQAQIEAEGAQQGLRQAALEAKRLDFVKVEQEFNALDGEVERLRVEKSDLFRQEAEKRTALENWQQQLAYLVTELEDNQTAIQELVTKIAGAETDYEAIGNQTENTKSRIAELESRNNELNRYLSVANQELHQLELKETRLQTEWENESVKLDEVFEITYEEALVYLDKSIPRSRLAKDVRELRREILTLGNVNLDSIEEYCQVSERHEFLTKQRQDLLDAKLSLNKVIKEMDSIMIKRFKQAFDDVNREFNRTFAKLFGGGSAGLAMTEPDDILETGIDMVVQPPGKKLVNYNLLSGGEKALIGIALILAIFQVKPSPFCVLDEVDAALDEANVDRFAEYLQDFARDVQFIVVSHRQGTMEAADTLWGVTMAADGVSKMVSVKLSDVVN